MFSMSHSPPRSTVAAADGGDGRGGGSHNDDASRGGVDGELSGVPKDAASGTAAASSATTLMTVPLGQVTPADVVFEHGSSRLLGWFVGNRRRRYQELLASHGRRLVHDSGANASSSTGTGTGTDNTTQSRDLLAPSAAEPSRTAASSASASALSFGGGVAGGAGGGPSAPPSHAPNAPPGATAAPPNRPASNDNRKKSEDAVARVASDMARSIIETIQNRDKGRFLEPVEPGVRGGGGAADDGSDLPALFRVVPRGQVARRLMETFREGMEQFASLKLQQLKRQQQQLKQQQQQLKVQQQQQLILQEDQLKLQQHRLLLQLKLQQQKGQLTLLQRHQHQPLQTATSSAWKGPSPAGNITRFAPATLSPSGGGGAATPPRHLSPVPYPFGTSPTRSPNGSTGDRNGHGGRGKRAKKITAPELAGSIPEDASSVFYVYDRRVNMDRAVGVSATAASLPSSSSSPPPAAAASAEHSDPSMYSLLRSWVQDDPHRKVLDGDLQDYETVRVPTYRPAPPTSLEDGGSGGGSRPDVWSCLEKQRRASAAAAAAERGVAGRHPNEGMLPLQLPQRMNHSPTTATTTPQPAPGATFLPAVPDLVREQAARYREQRKARKRALRKKDRHVLDAMKERGIQLL
jgi:hypothetical protein